MKVPGTMIANPQRMPAFTLIETIIVILGIGVFLSLLLPAIAGARGRVERVANLSAIRSHAQVFSLYAANEKDMWPVFVRADSTGTRVTGGGFTIELQYFDMYSSWNIALADTYYHGSFASDMFFPRGYFRDSMEQETIFTPYTYSCAFVAEPTYWNRSTRFFSTIQWHGTRTDQVRYPAAKALLVNSWPAQDVQPIENPPVHYEISFADGSAALVPVAEIMKGYYRGDGDFSLTQSGHMGDYPPGVHTIDGVLGRDINR